MQATHIPLNFLNNLIYHLQTLDKKITLNRQINQTLEQMAQTLFKSWFVDFDPVIDNALDAGNEIPELLQTRAELRQKIRASQDFQPLPADIRALFPAEFEESELGWVPKGWVSAAKSAYLPSLYCATFFAMGSSGTFQGSRASSFSRVSASPICASTWLIYADGSRSLALAVSSNE